VFEGLRWNKAYLFLRRLTLPLVVIGIGLSTLHQSSLGTLFVLNPNRLHPLWYSPLLPVIFFVSAVALGLAMVTSESLISSWLFHREPEWPLLSGLTRAASVVLGIYLVLRLGDLAARGQLWHAVEGSWASALFGVEILVSVVVPVLLFTLPSLRRNHRAVAAGAFLVVGGFILHRATVAGIAQMPRTGSFYLPAATEVFVSLGVVAAMALIFLFFVEHLRVWEEPPAPLDHFRRPMVDPSSSVLVRSPWLGGVQRAALAWVIGALLGAGLVELQVMRRDQPRLDPVDPPRAVAILRADRHVGPGHRLLLAASMQGATSADGELENALLLAGARGGYVVFEHDRHVQRLGGVTSCGTCHHENFPLARATSCRQCHRDMYRTTDTFDHERHVAALGTNASCMRCHPDPGKPKTRAAATACASCHAADASPTARVKVTIRLPQGIAVGYRAAMHGLCITCHRAYEKEKGIEQVTLSRCPNCHREATPNGDDLRLRKGWVLASYRGGAR
jgi:hypothetical protein